MPRPQTPGDMIAAIKRGLKEKTGKEWDEWMAIAKKTGVSEHSKLTEFLKAKGLGHSTASLISRSVLKPGWDTSYEDPVAMVKQQYEGKAELKPIYEAVLKAGKSLGRDVAARPCATYVPLIRRSQFAVIQPSTKTRVDLGLALKGVQPQGRLEAAKGVGGGAITHRIKLSSKAEVDGEVKRWLKAAYEANA